MKKFIKVTIAADHDNGRIGARVVYISISDIAIVGDRLQYATGAFTTEGRAAIKLSNGAASGGSGVYELDEKLDAFIERLDS